jgi:hypothetical protein
VFDGKKEHTVYEDITFNVMDVQDSPPVFTGSFTGIVNEDDPIGTTVLTVTAKDGDTGNPRKVIYELEENPNNYFLIDPNSGEIRIDRNLDRESLSATSGVLTLRVKALELVDGIPGNDETTTSVTDVTITIRDINDEPPKFNKREYEVIIPENVPFGTPLAKLNFGGSSFMSLMVMVTSVTDVVVSSFPGIPSTSSNALTLKVKTPLVALKLSLSRFLSILISPLFGSMRK